MTNDKVIALGMLRINSFKTSREDKFVPINKVRASVRTNLITISQPHVITKKDVNSNTNGLSSTGVDITTKTRRPQTLEQSKICNRELFALDNDAAFWVTMYLQWGNILFYQVYFVEGLGHNCFRWASSCDSDLEGISPTQSSSNSKQRLHTSSYGFVGSMRVEKYLMESGYVLVIVDDYLITGGFNSLRSKDEAPEVIKTFLKKIQVLLQALVIIVRTDNGTKFKNQVLKEYFDSVGISHQYSSVRTP
ncbi:retrovirus-related pol polyprotein from transposon TNT 1-94 [Tanacetum coccineum]